MPEMVANCSITFFRADGGDGSQWPSFMEEFCDPYIYLDAAGMLWHWNDHEWHAGTTTWGGRPFAEGMLVEPLARRGGPAPATRYP